MPIWCDSIRNLTCPYCRSVQQELLQVANLLQKIPHQLQSHLISLFEVAQSLLHQPIPDDQETIKLTHTRSLHFIHQRGHMKPQIPISCNCYDTKVVKGNSKESANWDIHSMCISLLRGSCLNPKDIVIFINNTTSIDYYSSLLWTDINYHFHCFLMYIRINGSSGVLCTIMWDSLSP